MNNFTHLENYISQFVHKRIAEPIRIEFKSHREICIKSRHPKGSTMLAVFWMKVLQHPDNYPAKRTHYFTVKRHGTERIFFYLSRGDSHMICVDLSSGQLAMTGHEIVTWFKDEFVNVLRRFIGLNVTNAWYEHELEHEHGLDGNATKQTVSELLVKSAANLNSLRNCYDELQTDGNADAIANIGLWPPEKLENARQKLTARNVLCNAKEFIAPFCLSMLDRWFSAANCPLSPVVYIASPKLDDEFLLRLIDLTFKHRSSFRIGAIFVPSSLTLNPAEVEDRDDRRVDALYTLQNSVLRHYKSSRERLQIEHNIFSKLVRTRNSIGSSYIAALFGEHFTHERDEHDDRRESRVEMITTSADFEYRKMTSLSFHNVCYAELSSARFAADYLRHCS